MSVNCQLSVLVLVNDLPLTVVRPSSAYHVRGPGLVAPSRGSDRRTGCHRIMPLWGPKNQQATWVNHQVGSMSTARSLVGCMVSQ